MLLLPFTLFAKGNFEQRIEIDTNLSLLQTTPIFNLKMADSAHKELEKRIFSGKYSFNRKTDYYLLFRYRDEKLLATWLNVLLENPENILLKMWFINAISQMKKESYLKFISPFKISQNAIIRECAANAYGLLASKDSIKSLMKWLESEKNDYVCKTIESSVKLLQRGGIKMQIPEFTNSAYYDSKPIKLQFFYNRDVIDNPVYNFSIQDTNRSILLSEYFIYPHQQYLWKIKDSPKSGYFGRKNRGYIYHVGIDSGWLLEGLPVHSISKGMVKYISRSLSWGHMIVIESITPALDTICVVYGHLSPLLRVHPGDTVLPGDNLGQIGNSVTFDNGGYWAHLHIGIEWNSFTNARLAGYADDTIMYANPLRMIDCYNVNNLKK
jgi:murein DD-endopeptidase MepM/ murein hydrolase activator NlpD